MKEASALFTQDDRDKIAKAIADAEERTSGEIVPVVASASGRYDRAEDLFGVVVATVAVALTGAVALQPQGGGWSSTPSVGLLIVAIVIALWAGFSVGAFCATKFPFLRLPFITREEMREEVESRALECFQRFRVRATQGGTGILIYVSVYERMVRVVGDDAIAAKLDQAHWDCVRDLLVDGLKGDRPVAGMSDAIAACGTLLSQHFPAQPGDENELINELHLIN